MVNYIRLACTLRLYRTCNPIVGFSKYEFNNKLLGDVTFFRNYIRCTLNPTIGIHDLYVLNMHANFRDN